MLEKINRIVFLRNTIEIQDNVVKYYYYGKKLLNYRTDRVITVRCLLFERCTVIWIDIELYIYLKDAEIDIRV